MPLPPPRAWPVLALAAALAGCAAVAPGPVPPGPVPLPGSFAPLVRQVLPAVVSIAFTETVPAQQLPGARRRFSEHLAGAGSGFIVSPDGVIVTNNHVVAHAAQILVRLTDGAVLPARVLGRDPLTDIAVLKVHPAHPLPAAIWGDSRKLAVGDWVLAAGNPFGLGGSVTAGIVSAEGRSLGDGPFDRFLQLDAPINPGNSGGPAFNLRGHVIGMTTAIVSPTGGSVGLGFAIPSDLVRRIVAQLRAHGSIARGWLAVAITDATGADTAGPAGVPSGTPGGARITGVDPTGPGALAGLRAGDIVTGVDGAPIADAAALIRAVAAIPPGTTIRITLRRGATSLTVPATLGRRPIDPSG